MANNLKFEKKVMAISALAEGNSIRSIERMTGIHRDTIMRLGVRVGNACKTMMGELLDELDCERIQLDEIWGYIGKKQKNVDEFLDSPEMGDVWTWVAIDADSKLVPCFHVGKRTGEDCKEFVEDLGGRLNNRIQISTDGLAAYLNAIDDEFGANVDYGRIVKTYSLPRRRSDILQQRLSRPKKDQYLGIRTGSISAHLL